MSPPSWIGQTLSGRYEILEVIGQGGMSAVYKARDPNLQRIVAIKLIHAHLLQDPKFVVRFEEEARAVAQLRHPKIVQVYDFNHDEDTYYMVQEFIPGETLQARLRRLDRTNRRMPLKEVIGITQDVLSAMSYAHSRGMIHRDIKPANIMLDVQGQAILMDFGIVKIVGGESHTATGAVVGTALYMSPELIRGEVPDERADLYSLGVTLFEMVSGHPPYEADSAMTLMMMHLNDPLPNLQSLRPEVPGDLVAVIEKALAKDRENRYRSSAEMSGDLSKVLERLERGVPYEAAGTMVEAAAPARDATLVEPGEEQLSGAPSESQPAASVPEKSPDQPAGTYIEQAQPSESARPAQGAPVVIGTQQASGSGAPPSGLGSGSGAGQPPAVPPASAFEQEPEGRRSPLLLYGGIAVAIVAVLIITSLLLRSRPGSTPDEPGAIAEVTTAAPALIATTDVPVDTPTVTIEATATISPTPTETALPTTTPTPTALPQVTPPTGVKFARIIGVRLDDQGRYEVNYDTFEYTEQLPGEHVHFFFNTVPPEQAGHPGSGPWILYGGPRPFTDYSPANRPANASAMCALVANPDHSVQPDSGNCWPLPDVPTLTVLQETQCLPNPEEWYAPLAILPEGTILLIRGKTQDETWWYVQNPNNLNESCWAPLTGTYSKGGLADVPVVEVTPPSP